MSNALIYSHNFEGHRQVYIFVLAHVLKEEGYKIVIAGNTKQVLWNSFYIDQLKKDPGILFLDTSKYADGGLNIGHGEFLELQNVCNCDLTVFAEADNHIPLFVSQISKKHKRFRGKLVGIFLRPFYYYEKTGLFDKLRYLKHLPWRWRYDDQLFHEFFLRRFSILNNALFIDENFVSHHKYCHWLPDVFQEYADLIIQDRKSDQRGWTDKLDEFKQKNNGKFLFLYFGTAQSRRGYDILLKMAVDNEACFIHCGLNTGTEKYVYDVNELRLSLKRNGRLFETAEYIEDPLCIEYFFKSVSHLILPYRNFFGSSGIMLQALSFGIPVLAPENGVIGYRIIKYDLGMTYTDKNESSLSTQFNIFKELYPRTFKDSITIYMNYQSTINLKKILINTFTGAGESVLHP